MSGRQAANPLFKEIHKKYDEEVLDNAFDVKWEVQRIDDDKISENVNFEKPKSEEEFKDQLLPLTGQRLIDALVEKVWPDVSIRDWKGMELDKPTKEDVIEWAEQWVPDNNPKYIQPENVDWENFYEWWGH